MKAYGGKAMRAKKLISLLLAVVMVLSITACGNSGVAAEATEGADGVENVSGADSAKAEHEPITIMSANKDYSGFIEYVKSVYPEINMEVVPYRGGNATQYMYDQLYTGYMPDIYSTTQMFTCYDKYPEHLIDLSKYDFTSKYNEARISQYELDGKCYLLPTDYDVIGLSYNASLFEREGWEVPTSFEELVTGPFILLTSYDINDTINNIEEISTDGLLSPGQYAAILMDVQMPVDMVGLEQTVRRVLGL